MRHPPPTSLLLALLALSSPTALAAHSRPKDAVLLSEVQSLTLTHGKMTSSRRVPAIPQLRCANRRPTAALCRLPHAQISTMRCVNQGSSYTTQDVEWACSAALPPTLRLERTEVVCEGYDSADDAYVLKGSCGVEYTLALTEEGERRFPHLAKNRAGEHEMDWGGVAVIVLFFAVLGWIVYSGCVNAGQDGWRFGTGPERRGGNGWGGGGGGGWWPGGGGGGPGRLDDPPPPYPGTKSADSTWRPGFWTGLASGAVAGYAAGNRGQRNDRDANYNFGRGSGSGTWGGGSGRSSSFGGSGSGARYESTGYGSTSRR